VLLGLFQCVIQPIEKLLVESLTDGVNSIHLPGVEIDSEPVLDIGSATRGSRIVTAVEVSPCSC